MIAPLGIPGEGQRGGDKQKGRIESEARGWGVSVSECSFPFDSTSTFKDLVSCC